ncbi:MAG TPA: glycine zipper family protein [Patescibacteria group bacterium]|nr:glycine zipper family protein [Patescibacteria group bacterium]
MKRVGTWVVLIALGVAVTSCATTEQPGYFAYPQQGQTAEQLSRDQGACQEWAKQQSGFDPSGMETVKGAGVGAVVGAVVGTAAGAAIGAATGSAGTGAAIGAATGGIGGALGGGSSAYARNKDGYDRAYAACMTGRGYVVR